MEALKTVALDVHTEWSQMAVISPQGELLIELQVPTKPDELRRAVSGIPGPKRVVMENGPLSAMIHPEQPGVSGDALEGAADQVVSCDPTKNALVSRSDSSNDTLDARRLGTLSLVRATHEVYVPPEPYRTLRSLVHYDYMLAKAVTRTKNQLKALLRRYGIACRGAGIYRSAGRKDLSSKLPNACVRWQLGSLYRQLDGLRLERVRACRMVLKQAKKVPAVELIRTVPGLGPRTAPTVAAWIADPARFKSESALALYSGLGLKNDWTAGKQVKRARASKRGNRELRAAPGLRASGRSSSRRGPRSWGRARSGCDTMRA